MPKQKPRNKPQLSAKHFLDKYADLLRELKTPGDSRPGTLRDLAGTVRVPFQLAIHYLNAAGFTPLLKAAQTEGIPDAFKEILELLIHSLGVEAPKGVFTPKPKTGKPGRRITSENEQIISTWAEIGEPPPGTNAFAEQVYGVAFDKADATDRRKMRDRCRNVVDRHRDRQIAELKNNVAKLKEEVEKTRAELQKKLADPK